LPIVGRDRATTLGSAAKKGQGASSLAYTMPVLVPSLAKRTAYGQLSSLSLCFTSGGRGTRRSLRTPAPRLPSVEGWRASLRCPRARGGQRTLAASHRAGPDRDRSEAAPLRARRWRQRTLPRTSVPWPLGIQGSWSFLSSHRHHSKLRKRPSCGCPSASSLAVRAIVAQRHACVVPRRPKVGSEGESPHFFPAKPSRYPSGSLMTNL
jgi:hypothetical protein